MFYTYILKKSNNTFYTGLTSDIKKRVDQHNSGQSISTRRFLPVELMYYIISPSRLEARALEVKIKNKGARRYLLNIIHRQKHSENCYIFDIHIV